MNIKEIAIASIRTDGDTQSRVGLNTDVVTEYAEHLQSGEPDAPRELPAVIVYWDGSDHWMADGFHRLHGYLQAGRTTIQADVRQGTQRDARLYACGANAQHGHRRTNEDKRRAVGLMLADAEWSLNSDRVIAKHCSVSNTFVSNIRTPKEAKAPVAPPAPPPVTGGAAAGPVNVDGKKKADAPAPPAAPAPAPAPAAPPEKTEAEKAAEDAHGGADLGDMLTETQAEVVKLQEQLAAASATDQGAEIIKWQRIADVAMRRQDELSEEIKAKDGMLLKQAKTIARIGRAVGEEDPSKIAATVEAFVRGIKVGA